MLFWTIFLLIILLLLSAFFSGVEVALVSVSRLKLRTLIKQKKSGAIALEELKKDPRKMIITILIGNNIVNISASVLASVVAISLFGSTGAGIAIGVMTFLVLVIGEITPKAYATTHYENIALNVAKPILILSKILSPIVIFLEWIAHMLLKTFGGHKKKKLRLTEEELKMAFDMGFEDKTIDKDEKKLLKNVLKFDDIAAKEVMTPNKEMFCLNGDMKVKEAVPLVAGSLYSRIPLYEKSINKIIGVVNIKDIFEAVNDKDHDLKLREIGVNPLFIQSNLMLDDI
ncbi:MAG: hemolysin family protein, partial [Nanoarchaeota archaeon]|nr:hemolysin family protein [Nanoarchaeota archaeon]